MLNQNQTYKTLNSSTNIIILTLIFKSWSTDFINYNLDRISNDEWYTYKHVLKINSTSNETIRHSCPCRKKSISIVI